MLTALLPMDSLVVLSSLVVHRYRSPRARAFRGCGQAFLVQCIPKQSALEWSFPVPLNRHILLARGPEVGQLLNEPKRKIFTHKKIINQASKGSFILSITMFDKLKGNEHFYSSALRPLLEFNSSASTCYKYTCKNRGSEVIINGGC